MEIIEKMVAGRLRKYLAEITLLGQPFVKDPDQTVSQLLADAGASVNSFIRYEVGEGIEKKQEDFAAEVAAQMKGSN
jgi:elongation factor Ts